MDDPPRFPATDEDRPRVPQWVRVALIASIVVVLAFVAVMLLGVSGGGHARPPHGAGTVATEPGV